MVTSTALFSNDNITSVDLFPEEAKQFSESYSSALAGQVAHINSTVEPNKPISEHYNEAKVALSDSDNYLDYIKGVVANYKSYYDGVLLEAAADTVDTGEEVLDVIADIRSIDSATTDLFDRSYALEAAEVLAAGGSNLDKAFLEQEFYKRKLTEISDGIGTFETIKDVGMFMLPTIGVDLAEITGGNVFTSYEDFKKLARNFWSLPMEDRLYIFPNLMKDFIDASDTLGIENKTKAVTFMATLFDPKRESQLDLENALEKTDWALIATPLITGAYKVIKGYNTIRKVAASGDIRKAADINTAALGDETVAASVNQDATVSGANVSPFKYEEILPEATDGLAEESTKLASAIEARRAATQKELDDIIAGEAILKESSLTEKEQILVQQNSLSDVEQLKDKLYEESGYHLTDADITGRTETGFTVSYKLDGIKKEQVVDYKVSDIGNFDYLSAGQIQTKIWSPQVWMDRILKDSVEVATRINFAQHKVLGNLQNASRSAVKGLSKKQRKDVDSVLLAGDAWNKGEGITFSITDLTQGISVGDRMVRLSPKEVSSYYAQRDIFDALHFLKNDQVRSDLDFHGWKGVDAGIELEKGRDVIAKPYETLGSIPNELYEKTFKILDTRGKGTLRLSSRMKLKELYEKDYRIAKMRSPSAFGKDLVDYALVKAGNITDLPAIVLNKKKGYVPKISEDGWFWVKKAESVTRNGRVASKISTIRAFDNMRDARKFSDDLNSKAADGVKYEPKRDRELTITEREDEILAEAGGLITGHRSSREIKFGLGEGTELKRVSAYEAMQRNLQHISTQIPINEWRMGMVKRWTNSANKYIDNPKKGLDAEIVHAQKGSQEEVALRSSREWIRDQLHIPTEAEQRWSNMTGRMGEWMEGKPFLDPSIKAVSPRRAMMNISSKDPFAAMRGAAFHTLLGWFNPAQLFVQAQGASIALALDPIAAPKRLKDYMALRAAYHVRDNPGAIKATAKASLMDAEELQSMVSQLNKTGLFESVKATADYNAAAQGYGTAMDAVRRAADKGLFIYTEGERFTRGYSFLTARAKWLKANPGKTIDDAALKDILTSTTTGMLNLTRANRAHWQKGAWSLPTQFQQVTTKFIENMMPNILPGAARKFSAGEKTRIMAGQLFLYGGAGVPFGTWIASELATASGQDPTTISDEWKAAATDGFWGFTSEMMFDTHFSTGTRGAFASGIEQFYEDLFLREVPASEAALGAFGVIPKRSLNAIAKLAPVVTNPFTFNYTSQELISAFNGVGDIISTYNNAHKAWMWYNYQAMTDSKGRTIAKLDKNEAFYEALGKGLGFNPARYTEYYKNKQWLATKADMEREARDAYRIILREYASPNSEYDEAHKKNFSLKQVSIFIGMDELQIQKIKETVHKNIWSEKTEEDKVIKKVIQSLWANDDVTQGKETVLFNKEMNN